jgi:hypothetical protein
MLKRIFGRRDPVAERRRRVAELARDPDVLRSIRESLEDERQGRGVRFEDLKRRDA